MILTLLIVNGLIGWAAFCWIFILAIGDNAVWAFAMFCCFPLAFVYAFLEWKKTRIPAILLGSALVMDLVIRRFA